MYLPVLVTVLLGLLSASFVLQHSLLNFKEWKSSRIDVLDAKLFRIFSMSIA